MKQLRSILAALVLAMLVLGLTFACAAGSVLNLNAADYPVKEDGSYTSKEEVAVYLATYGKLPSNYITKAEAEAMGWKSSGGTLDKVAPGYSIGGSHFGNYEGKLPDAKGRKWTECDINYKGGSRNAERILFSNDGLIYYTNDHYNTYTEIKVSFDQKSGSSKSSQTAKVKVKKKGEYTSKEEVAAYLNQFGCLPGNYITRSEAKELGWTNKKNNLGTVAPGRIIGGDTYENREKLLPTAKGRTYYECDVNSENGKRSKERLVYSSDGLIFYTPDGGKTFTQLY